MDLGTGAATAGRSLCKLLTQQGPIINVAARCHATATDWNTHVRNDRIEILEECMRVGFCARALLPVTSARWTLRERQVIEDGMLAIAGAVRPSRTGLCHGTLPQ